MADDHTHDGDDHEHHDADPTEASSQPAADPERLARLDRELAALSVADLDTGMRALAVEQRRALAQRVGIKLDPRFMKGGMGKLIKGRIGRVGTRGRLEVAGDLTMGLERDGMELLGEESFESPSSEDIERLVEHLSAKWPIPLVRTYLACTAAAEAPVAAQLDELLETDPRLKV